MFIDVHCHIDIYSDAKIKSLIEKARESNVNLMINNSIDIKTARRSLELSSKYPEVKPALGIYPIEALKLSDDEIEFELEFIRKNKSKIVAIGEVGMDFKMDDENHNRQGLIFEKFINLSKELNIPIIVHSRQAEKEAIEILEKLKAKKVIMHYFCGGNSLVKRIIKNGWLLSIPSSIKHNKIFQDSVSISPIENLLCETDSPFGHPDRKRNNTPINVIKSYKMISKIKNLDLKEVEKKIEKNYERLFK